MSEQHNTVFHFISIHNIPVSGPDLDEWQMVFISEAQIYSKTSRHFVKRNVLILPKASPFSIHALPQVSDKASHQRKHPRGNVEQEKKEHRRQGGDMRATKDGEGIEATCVCHLINIAS